MIQASAPGKLFIAGEYAVIEPGYSAILVAVDQFISVNLEKTYNEGSISIYGSVPILWSRDDSSIIFERSDNRILYIKEAINIVEEYLRELDINLNYYKIDVSSQLESHEGIKYGLGSSAAVTVAAIKALLKFYKVPLTSEGIFKLAALANLSVNSNSSCGDIAASVYGGWIAYTTFDKNLVLSERVNVSLTQLLNMEWKGLSIEPLTPPKELRLLVGWTGKPASTTRLVDKFNKELTNNKVIYVKFLDDSKICLSKMIDAFRNQDIDEIQKQIKVNRELLVRVSEALGLVIETPMLRKLCDIALEHNGYAKSSGAGGGDCGIVILKDESELTNIINEWEKRGISYLPLKVHKIEGENID